MGVWLSARAKRSLRIVGALLVADGLIGFFWPPMHLRGAGTSLTDTMHIFFTAVTVPILVAAILVGATAFGRWFRISSIASIVLTLGFGALTGLSGARIPNNLPTPWVGVWERISIAAFMAWFVVLAVALLRAARAPKLQGRAPEVLQDQASGADDCVIGSQMHTNEGGGDGLPVRLPP